MKILHSWIALLLLVAGCATVPNSPKGTPSAIGISLPGPVSIDGPLQTIALVPTLEITNTTGKTFALLRFGSRLPGLTVDFEVFDPNGLRIPAIRTDFRGSTLVGTRVFVTQLEPGQSLTWCPEHVTSYRAWKKGTYHMSAHVHIPPAEPQWQRLLGDKELPLSAAQDFESGSFAFPVI